MIPLAITLAVVGSLFTLAWWDVQRRKHPKRVEDPAVTERVSTMEAALKNALAEIRAEHKALTNDVKELKQARDSKTITRAMRPRAFTGITR